MAFASTSHSYQAGLKDRFFALLQEASARLGRHRLYKRTLNELGELNNRELADLGLCRANLRSVAYEAAYGA